MHTWTPFILIGCVFVSPVNAEEHLIKPTGTYLGWKTQTGFRACDSQPIEIGTGRIAATSEKCRQLPLTSHQWRGTLESANPATGSVRILANDGTRLDLYLPPHSKSWPQLKDISSGGWVKASGPVPGRAETIEVWK